MLPARSRLFGALITGAVLALLVAAGGVSSTSRSTQSSVFLSRSIDVHAATRLRAERLARAAITWRGGPIITSTGETVTVLVSDGLPVETVTPEGWAEFIARLTHGPEITALTSHFATLEEVRQICGQRALGCYTGNEMVSLGEAAIDGTTPEEVVRHEYGHHVAFHRVNSPWPAIDWGPKQWASTANVCARVGRREAFPGDEGNNYSQNPGEAWAEVYRLMDERKNGITTASWSIISQSFFPDEAALQAAERDVVQPWTAGKTVAFRRTFGNKTKVWWIPLATPLDGDLRVTASLPTGGSHDVALVGANRRTVIRRAQWIGQRAKRLVFSVCGHRSLFLRVTRGGAVGRVSVTATGP